MKIHSEFLYAALLSAAAFVVCDRSVAQPVSSDNSRSIYLADPAILLQGKTYYLYGTMEGKTGSGFPVYSSHNLKQWKRVGAEQNDLALNKRDAFGTGGFWAPHVFPYHTKYYMAYVANEHIAIAHANAPSGPFTQDVKKALDAPVKQIDPFIFVDVDGKKYLYHVRLTKGNRIFVAEINDSLTAIKEETLSECIAAEERWENTANASWPVAEGPTVIRHKNMYYLIYSANDFRNPDYAVGYAVSSHPLGPWTKYSGNPILSRRETGVNGSGHGDLFSDKRGRLQYVFHTHFSNEKVSPRRSAIIRFRFVREKDAADRLIIDRPTFRFLETAE